MLYDIDFIPYTIFLGRLGENKYDLLEFNVQGWLDRFPSGKISIIFQRPDGVTYPIVVDATTSPISWQTTSTDLAVSGPALIKARIIEDDVIGKSTTIRCFIEDSFESHPAPPPPSPDWVQEILLAKDEIENMTVTAKQLDAGTPPTVDKTIKDGVVNLDFGIPKGKDFEILTDETLSIIDGKLSVNRATQVEKDNTLPITAAAVYTEVGNIEVLLAAL